MSHYSADSLRVCAVICCILNSYFMLCGLNLKHCEKLLLELRHCNCTPPQTSEVVVYMHVYQKIIRSVSPAGHLCLWGGISATVFLSFITFRGQSKIDCMTVKFHG